MPPSTLAERLAAVRAERSAGRPTVAAPRPSARSLAQALRGRVVESADGAVVVVERALPMDERAVGALIGVEPASYFDTETTGLSTAAGTLLFMGGVARLDAGSLIVTQFVLPDQPHEPALLRALVSALAAPRLVSYNGRAFDVQLLSGRLALHALDELRGALPARHDDLLPDARRLWRRPLGGARLADVELGVLGLRRTSDCPSFEIPGRYLAYLRGASPDILVEVLDHNAQDVVSLALLDARIHELEAGGWRAAAGFDPRGMALHLLRRGSVNDALEVLDAALEQLQLASDEAEASALRRLAARTLVAAGMLERAEQVWRSATRRASAAAALSWIEIARIRERHRGDVAGAYQAAEAASRILDLALALGRGGGVAELARARLRVESRRRRLAGRVRAAQRASRARRPAARAAA